MVGEGVVWWWPRLWLEMTEPGLELELQKKVHEDFTSTERAPTRACGASTMKALSIGAFSVIEKSL